MARARGHVCPTAGYVYTPRQPWEYRCDMPDGWVCLYSPPAVGVQVWCDNAGHVCPNWRVLMKGPTVPRCCQLGVCFENYSAKFTSSPAGGVISGVRSS